MNKSIVRWVQAHADLGAIIAPGGLLKFALRLSGLIVVMTEAAVVFIHLILVALGLLPYPLSQALAVGCTVAFMVAGVVGFVLTFSVGSAIRSLAINRDDFRRLSTTDELSGLMNRRAFFRAMAGDPDAALILIDIDHFKGINDRYGHLAGDDVIRDLGRQFTSASSGIPMRAGRLGGEEFGILLPGRCLTEAFDAAEAIRHRVADSPVRTRSGPVQVTISGGVTAPYADDGPDDMYRRCDWALYAAKNAGRNRMMTHDAIKPLRACG